MGQLNIRIPGFAKSDFFRRDKNPTNGRGFKVYFPTEKENQSEPWEQRDSHAGTSAKQASEAQCKSIELRIIQDGKIYRSKAEEERLNALGQWHHRRMRRRERMRR